MADKQEDDCVWCDRIWAVIGAAIGAGLLYIAVDTFTGGGLTQWTLSRGRPVLASVTQMPARGEDETA